MHFVSNTDPEGFADVLKKVDLESTLLVNMSKSGSTAETKVCVCVFVSLGVLVC